MQELIILALALIGATITWNISRVRQARKEMAAQGALYNQNENAATELGQQREELRVLRARHEAAAASGLFEDADGSCAAMWTQVDGFVARSAQQVMRMNFVAALAEMCKATTVADEYLKNRLPVVFYDAKKETAYYYPACLTSRVRGSN